MSVSVIISESSSDVVVEFCPSFSSSSLFVNDGFAVLVAFEEDQRWPSLICFDNLTISRWTYRKGTSCSFCTHGTHSRAKFNDGISLNQEGRYRTMVRIRVAQVSAVLSLTEWEYVYKSPPWKSAFAKRVRCFIRYFDIWIIFTLHVDPVAHSQDERSSESWISQVRTSTFGVRSLRCGILRLHMLSPILWVANYSLDQLPRFFQLSVSKREAVVRRECSLKHFAMFFELHSGVDNAHCVIRWPALSYGYY